jgi:hypothetical protein
MNNKSAMALVDICAVRKSHPCEYRKKGQQLHVFEPFKL